MEYVQKYWYLVLAALVLLFFLSRRSAPAMQQVGGSDATTLALYQMASAERGADLDRQFGLAGAFMNYDLASRQVDQQLDLAQIQATANAQALASQDALARLSFALQQGQINSQYGLQQAAINQQAGAQSRNDWLNLIGSGVQSILPSIFGSSSGGGIFGNLGTWRTPPTFPQLTGTYDANVWSDEGIGGWWDMVTGN